MKRANAHLVDRGADWALQHHLQHLEVRRVLLDRTDQVLRPDLHVLDSNLDGTQDDLRSDGRVAWEEAVKEISCSTEAVDMTHGPTDWPTDHPPTDPLTDDPLTDRPNSHPVTHWPTEHPPTD